jgi:hypothetical protein
MAAQVLSFFQRSPRHAPAPTDWSQQELAEFYRVESALIRAGIRVGTDRGLSDENEPWFVFYRADDGEVVIHFARIDGEYLIAGPAYEEIARGFDFSTLVRNMVASHPLIRRSDRGGNLSIHPAALLVAVVGTAFFKTGEARAAESGATNATSGHSRPALLLSSSSAGLSGGVAPASPQAASYDSVQIPANHAVQILAAALLTADYGVDPTSLDPNVRTAIAAAAASLDFGGVSTISTTPTEIAPVGATAHVVADNTPVQTITSMLSLVAILSTLPHAMDAGQIAEASFSGLAIKDHTPAAIGSPTMANENTWSIHVGLGAGSLPSVQAVQLVRGVLGEPGYQKVSVIELAQLPDILANIIAHSSNHYTVAPSGYVAGPPSTDVSTPVTETPAPNGGESVNGGGTSPPPTNGGTVLTPPETPVSGGGEIITPPKDPIPDPVTPPLPATTQPDYISQEMVKMFVDYFLAHTTTVEVIVTGTSIVAFDARILHNPGLIHDPESITFSLADGGSVSLVGDASAFIQHTGLLH